MWKVEVDIIALEEQGCISISFYLKQLTWDAFVTPLLSSINYTYKYVSLEKKI